MKARVISCVTAIYVYVVLFSVLRNLGVKEDTQRTVDNTFHSMVIVHLTIIFYILLYIAFKNKMEASYDLQEGHDTHVGGNIINRQMGLERKFIIINFLLPAILFLSSQPSAMFWIVRLYSKENPNSPNVLIINLVVDNILYLKFLLDPFVYAWRIPKYRQALKIVLRCTRTPSTARQAPSRAIELGPR